MSGRKLGQAASIDIAAMNRHFYQCLPLSMSIRLLELRAGSRGDAIKWYQHQTGLDERLRELASNGIAIKFAHSAASAFDRRLPFMTTQGLIAMCPLLMRPSDIVVVLFGGRTPYILRQMENHYRLVSDCYVYGLMDGEAVKMWQEGDLEVRDFELH